MVDDTKKGKEVHTEENNGYIKLKKLRHKLIWKHKLKTEMGREKSGTMGFYTCAWP